VSVLQAKSKFQKHKEEQNAKKRAEEEEAVSSSACTQVAHCHLSHMRELCPCPSLLALVLPF